MRLWFNEQLESMDVRAVPLAAITRRLNKRAPRPLPNIIQSQTALLSYDSSTTT